MNVQKFLPVCVAATLGALAEGCTAGAIVNQNGSAWNIQASTVVELIGARDYEANAWTMNGLTVFSFDPYGPVSLDNTQYAVPQGDYAIYVSTNYGESLYQSNGDAYLNDEQNCPYKDYFTNATVPCQLLQLTVYESTCWDAVPKPYQNGSVLVVPVGNSRCQ